MGFVRLTGFLTATAIDSKWSTTSRTRYDYVYNARGQRYAAKQSGDVFGNYGGSTYQRGRQDGARRED